MNGSKKKFFLNLFVAAILVLGFSSFGVDYFVQEIEGSSSRIVAGKQDAYMLRSKSGQLSDARKKYEEVESKLDLASQTIIDNDRTVDFIKAAEAAAKENKVKWNIETAGSKATMPAGGKSAFISSSDFTFKIGGSFDAVMKFLYTMENFQYDVDISQVRMSFGDFDEYNADVIVLTFDLKLYQKDSQQ